MNIFEFGGESWKYCYQNRVSAKEKGVREDDAILPWCRILHRTSSELAVLKVDDCWISLKYSVSVEIILKFKNESAACCSNPWDFSGV